MSGDCWFCLLRTTETNESLGEVTGDPEHLREHVAEGYVMLSLLLNAIKAKGYRYPEVIVSHSPDSARSALSTYLRKRLLVDVMVSR
jgi:hypothetical protein